jgi:hypothetical protein
MNKNKIIEIQKVLGEIERLETEINKCENVVLNCLYFNEKLDIIKKLSDKIIKKRKGKNGRV